MGIDPGYGGENEEKSGGYYGDKYGVREKSEQSFTVRGFLDISHPTKPPLK